MGIGQKADLFQMQGSLFVHKLGIHIHSHDVGKEHIVRAQLVNLTDFTLQRDGAFGDTGSGHHIGGLGGEAGQGELVHIAARFDAAQVGGLHNGLTGQVDNELALLLNDAVGIPLGADGYIGHGGLAVDDARPGGGEHIVRLHGPAGHQRRGRGGQQGAGLPL